MGIENRISVVIKSLGISQKEFANTLEVPSTTISKYKSGDIKPSFDILSKIGIEFKVNLNWLLTGEGEMFISENTEKNSSKNREKELEKEIAELKKNINSLEIGNRELSQENAKLHRELIKKMDQLIAIQNKLITS